MHHTWKLLFSTWSDLDREKLVKEEAAIKCDGEVMMMMMQEDDWANLSSRISDRVKHGEWIKAA
jgi:hypothetical protein